MKQSLKSLPHGERVLAKLQTLRDLSFDELGAIGELSAEVRKTSSGQDILTEGDTAVQCCAVLDGLAYRYKMLGDGARQITAYDVPGDMPDLLCLHLSKIDYSLAALTSCMTAHIQHEDIIDLSARMPNVANAFWKSTLVEAAIQREWIVNMGRRPAYARVAHLICELTVRLREAPHAEARIRPLRLTQADIADTAGLSAVHVNRVMKQLKEAKLIGAQGREIRVLDFNGLQAAGGFDPAYLHMPGADPGAGPLRL